MYCAILGTVLENRTSHYYTIPPFIDPFTLPKILFKKAFKIAFFLTVIVEMCLNGFLRLIIQHEMGVKRATIRGRGNNIS